MINYLLMIKKMIKKIIKIDLNINNIFFIKQDGKRLLDRTIKRNG